MGISLFGIIRKLETTFLLGATLLFCQLKFATGSLLVLVQWLRVASKYPEYMREIPRV